MALPTSENGIAAKPQGDQDIHRWTLVAVRGVTVGAAILPSKAGPGPGSKGIASLACGALLLGLIRWRICPLLHSISGRTQAAPAAA
jgi:hypothetical protein